MQEYEESESQDQEEQGDEAQDGGAGDDNQSAETTDDKSADEKKTDDPAERNRQGYAKRQESRTTKADDKGVSREELDSVKAEIESLKAEKNDLAWRNANPGVNDDEFAQIKAAAKSHGKNYDDVMGMPIFKDHFERKDAKTRTESATPTPGTRSGAGTKPNFSTMSSDEFRDYQNKVLNK
jgi:hypothetical protein